MTRLVTAFVLCSALLVARTTLVAGNGTLAQAAATTYDFEPTSFYTTYFSIWAGGSPTTS